MDRFRVEVITKTPNPQQVIYAAMHQDYTEAFVYDQRDSWPSEEKCGEIIIKRLLGGERGHYGPLEHSQTVFNCGYFPHSLTLPPLKGMGLLRNFVLNIPEIQLRILRPKK